jgi:outer membrane protein assembly factor BamA
MLAGHGAVAGVEFHGNRKVNEEAVAEAFRLRQGSASAPDSIDAALERLLEFYVDLGYVMASAELKTEERGDSLHLVVRIDEGDRYRLGQITVTGNEAVEDDAVLSQMDSRPGRAFSARVFEDDMERILRLFEDKGFAFVQLMPESFNYDTIHHEIDLTLRVVEGRKAKFAGTRFSGLQSTKPEYLARESGIRAGDVFSSSRLRAAERRLSRLTFLSGIGEFRPVRAQREDEVWAEVELVEGRANTIYGVLGYEPGTDGRLTGLVDLTLENLAGWGRGVEARWRRTSTLTSWLYLKYREPFLLSYDVAVQGVFEHHIRDTSYTESGLSLEFQSRSAGFLGLSWGFSADQVLPGAYPLPRSRGLGVLAGVWIDTRQRPGLGEQGLFYEIRSEYMLRSNSPTDLVSDPEPSASTGRLLADLHHHIPTGLVRELYVAGHGREAYTSEDEVPVYDHFFLGGANSVRGYREEQFSGFRVGWVNLEARFGLARNSYVYPFVDVGYYLGANSETVVGYGFGLSVGTRLGVLGLDYGLGEGDGPLDGKVHLKLTGEF